MGKSCICINLATFSRRFEGQINATLYNSSVNSRIVWLSGNWVSTEVGNASFHSAHYA